MFSSLLKIAFVATVLSVASAKDSVMSMTGAEFQNYLANKRSGWVMVKFYAPWCPHCIKMAPEFENAAEELGDVDFVQVNCDDRKNDAVCDRYNVDGYPTLKLINAANGHTKDYSGKRTAKGFLNYICKVADIC